jgi:RNA polymerase sigma factor (sigma-70 family)
MNTSDAELVYQSLSHKPGADEAFTRLVARYRPGIYGLAFAATGNVAEAEDLTQETLIAAYLGLPRLRDPSRFGVWLYGIARNVVRMWYRRRANTPALDGGHAIAALEDRSQRSPEERLDRQESLARIREAVQELSTGNREAITLRYWGEMSYAEISATLNVPLSTVKSRLHKAKRQLQARLGEKRMEQRIKMIPVKVGELYTHDYQGQPHAIVLLESEDGRSLPIWIGRFEGLSLALNRVLESDELMRPLTYDTVANIFDTLSVRLEKVTVSALKDTTFLATLHLWLGEVEHEIDARPSDAINLAVRVSAPIFVAEDVMNSAAKSAPIELPEDVKPLELPESILKMAKEGPETKEDKKKPRH